MRAATAPTAPTAPTARVAPAPPARRPWAAHPARVARLAAAALLGSAALLAPVRARGQTQVDERRPLLATGSVKLYNLFGSIRVIGWERDSVAVTGTLSLGERLFVGGTPQGLKIGVESPEERTVRGAHLVLRVPARARVWVKTSGAEIVVSGVTGGLDLYSVGASIRVTGSPRELNAEAMDGAVEVNGSPAWLRVKTATGAIALRGGGEDVRLSSVSGPITVQGGTLGRGAFENVTGDIQFAGAVERSGALTFDAHSGGVEVALARPVAADFDVVTIAGEIENYVSPARPVAGRDARGRELHFATSPDGARVTVRSFKGRVVLRAAP